MIIRIKKKWLITVFVLMLIAPYAYGIVVRFGAELWISNVAPIMVLDFTRSFSSASPTDGTTTLVWFVFNVTDDNGEDGIDERGAYFNITLGTPGSAQWRYNSSCINVSKIGADNKVVFNCSVYMWYFDNSSSNWIINGTANDTSGSRVYNGTNKFTYNELSAVSFPVAYINFTALTLGAQNQPASGVRLILNNTGNDDFEQINITASALVGVTVSGETIPVGNFVVNATTGTDGAGTPLTAGDGIIIRALTQSSSTSLDNVTLFHGHTRALSDYNDNIINVRGNQSLYYWVDVPSSGLSVQKYNATWNLTIVDLP